MPGRTHVLTVTAAAERSGVAAFRSYAAGAATFPRRGRHVADHQAGQGDASIQQAGDATRHV